MDDAISSGSDFDNVYLGFWTNWAKGSVRGFTLTTSRQSGGLLVAFLAIYVGTSGKSFWRLSCLMFHRIVSGPVAHDALFHQRQVLLRNSDTPMRALKDLLYMTIAWRGIARRPIRRLLALILWAVSISLAFSAAGLFSSRVTTETASEVLIDGSKCRLWHKPENASIQDVSLVMFTFMSQQTTAYLAYAQRCYMGAGNPDECRQYVKPRIPFNITRNAPCPFDDHFCKAGSIIIDTGFLNSNLDLGINLPKEAQFDLRITTQCAPTHSSNYTSLHNQSDLPDIPLVRYHLGNFSYQDGEVLDYVYQVPANLSVSSSDGWSPSLMSKLDYNSGVNAVLGGTYEDILSGNQLVLIPELQRSDADVSLFFLSAAGLAYSLEVDDPWYSAHTPGWDLIAPQSNGTGTVPTFQQDEPASVLGCITQSQICNPNGANGPTCLPLAGFIDNVHKIRTLWENPSNDTANLLDFIADTLYVYQIFFDRVVYVAGNAALSARQSLSAFSSLPNDQWEKEVLLWAATSTAGLHGMFEHLAMGLRGMPLEYTAEPDSEVIWKVCKNQRIISTRFTSFNVLGIVVILLVGSTFIVLDWTLESCLDLVQTNASKHDRGRLEWKANATLQLHRMAHEQVGSGVWSNATGAVPITSPGELLTSLDIENKKHPRLVSSEIKDTKIKVENTQNESDHGMLTAENENTQGESDLGMLSGRW